MTGICVSLVEETTTALIDRMVDLGPHADLFEIRGDRVRDLDLLMLLRARSKPLLFTCRAESEGGNLADADPLRREMLREAVKRGFDYVDVEHRSELLEIMAAKIGRGLVVSFHDTQGTPEDLDRLYVEMAARGADVVKIVVTPRSISDVGRLLAFAARAAASGGPPLVALALGALGAPTRILAGRYGAPFTYASAAAGAEAARGQIPARTLGELYRARQITARTRVYGILGGEVSHSLSPLIHNRAFAACGLDATYVPLQAEALAPFLAACPALGLSGFSVTRPYKVEILPHLDRVDEEAALCGSVNTVVVVEGRLFGSTTDGMGVTAPLERRLPLEGAAVAILGAGGAARSAALALRRKGAAVSVLARDLEKAAEVARAIGCDYGALASPGRHAFDVVLNATPVGSGPLGGQSPWPAHLHRKGGVAFDMVYEPLETPFLRAARAAGATTLNGLEMLLAQAAGQFETWFGQEAPLALMREALFAGRGGVA